MDAPKSIRETEKNPKNPLTWAKNPKKSKKNQKTQKKQKKTHWAGFFFKNPGFFQPCLLLVVDINLREFWMYQISS
jgi:hypothetical protein